VEFLLVLFLYAILSMGCVFLDVEKIDGRRGGNFLMGNYVNDAASESSGHETDPYEDFEIYSIVSIGE